jgi:hypothetical protein
MNIRFWRKTPERIARVEFRDQKGPRVLRGVKRLVHKGCFITLRTKDELYHWHQSEVRLVHVHRAEQAISVKKEASF